MDVTGTADPGESTARETCAPCPLSPQGDFPGHALNILSESSSLREQPQSGQSPSQEQRTTLEDAGDNRTDCQNRWTSTEWLISPVTNCRCLRQAAPRAEPAQWTILSGLCGEPFPPVPRRRGHDFTDTCSFPRPASTRYTGGAEADQPRGRRRGYVGSTPTSRLRAGEA